MIVDPTGNGVDLRLEPVFHVHPVALPGAGPVGVALVAKGVFSVSPLVNKARTGVEPRFLFQMILCLLIIDAFETN